MMCGAILVTLMPTITSGHENRQVCRLGKRIPKVMVIATGIEPSSDIFHSPAITIQWSAMKDRWKEELELTA